MNPDDQAIPSFWLKAKPSPKLLAMSKDELAQIILRKCNQHEEVLKSLTFLFDMVSDLAEKIDDDHRLADHLLAAHIKATRNRLDRDFKDLS